LNHVVNGIENRRCRLKGRILFFYSKVGHHEISSTAFSAGPVFSNWQANAFYLAVDSLVHEKNRDSTTF